jgi:hypothetical protein
MQEDRIFSPVSPWEKISRDKRNFAACFSAQMGRALTSLQEANQAGHYRLKGPTSVELVFVPTPENDLIYLAYMAVPRPRKPCSNLGAPREIFQGVSTLAPMVEQLEDAGRVIVLDLNPNNKGKQRARATQAWVDEERGSIPLRLLYPDSLRRSLGELGGVLCSYLPSITHLPLTHFVVPPPSAEVHGARFGCLTLQAAPPPS